jgi:hypothetical protein
MRPIEVVAWTEALGVGQKELPWALASRVRLIEDLHSEITRLRVGLSSAPDEDMLASISSASRAIGAAGDRLTEALSDLRRGEP